MKTEEMSKEGSLYFWGVGCASLVGEAEARAGDVDVGGEEDGG
jgi:hypothetical protein